MTFWTADFCKFQKIHRENTGLGISFNKFSTFFHNSSGWPFKIIGYDFLLDFLEWSTVSIYLYIRTCFEWWKYFWMYTMWKFILMCRYLIPFEQVWLFRATRNHFLYQKWTEYENLPSKQNFLIKKTEANWVK